MKQNNAVGMVFGGFYPLHLGHINLIERAYRQVDKLYVINSTSKTRCDLSNKEIGIQNRKITGELQINWLNTEFSMLDNIKIIQINEDDLQIPESPNGWMEWSSWIKFLCSDHIDIVFTSQIEYLPYINKYFPDSSCRILSKEINISATEIRKNIYKYWEFLPKSVKSYYTYRVCFVGTESCGKSTISNMIAHKFNYGIVNEFGREFVNTKYNGDESKLTTKDFIEIGDIQSLRIRESSENSNGISIIDTDLYITQFYHKLYFNIENYPLAITIKEHELHFPVDLYIYLSDDVEWVSDGLRMNGTKEQRLNTKKLLWDTLPTNVNILTVNGTSYEDRYNNVERVFERIIKDINAR